MSNMKKRLAAAGLCLALSVGMLTGCQDAGKAIITLNGAKTEYAVANIILRYNQAQMQTYYGAYMGENMWSQYGDSTKTDVMNSLKQMLILEQHMEEYEVTVTEEEKKAISDAAAKFIADNEKNVLKAMGATQERMERVLTLFTIQSKMSKAMVADTDTNVSDEEAAQKTIKYAFFSTADTTDEEGNTVARTDAEKAEIFAQAQSVLSDVEGGADMDEVLKAIDENKAASTASYGDNDENSSLDEAVRTAADALKDGETAKDVITVENGYYVVQMVSTFDKDATEQKKQSIISQRKTDKFNEIYEGWAAEADYKEDADLVKTMTFKDTYELKLPETEAAETSAETEAQETEAAETSAETEAQETEGTETSAETEQ